MGHSITLRRRLTHGMIGVALLTSASCGLLDSVDLRLIPIARIDVASTIQRGDSALVVFFYPSPCYHSRRLYVETERDTIRWALMANYVSRPCTDNVVPDSFYTPIDPGRAGDFILSYKYYDSTVILPLTITEP